MSVDSSEGIFVEDSMQLASRGQKSISSVWSVSAWNEFPLSSSLMWVCDGCSEVHTIPPRNVGWLDDASACIIDGKCRAKQYSDDVQSRQHNWEKCANKEGGVEAMIFPYGEQRIFADWLKIACRVTCQCTCWKASRDQSGKGFLEAVDIKTISLMTS